MADGGGALTVLHSHQFTPNVPREQDIEEEEEDGLDEKYLVELWSLGDRGVGAATRGRGGGGDGGRWAGRHELVLCQRTSLLSVSRPWQLLR